MEIPLGAADYSLNLEDEELRRIGRWLLREIEQYRNDMADRLANSLEWRNAARNAPPGLDGPWENASDIRAPYTAIACQRHTQLLNQQIVAPDPAFVARAKNQQTVDLAPYITEAVLGEMEEADWRSVARQVHEELPITGQCLVQVTRKIETIWVPEVSIDVNEAILDTLVAGGLQPDAALHASVEVNKEGNPILTVSHNEMTIRDGIEIEMIPFEESIVFPSYAAKTCHAWGLGRRIRVRGGVLMRGAEKGIYIKSAVEKLMSSRASSPLDPYVDEKLQDSGIRHTPYDGDFDEYREFELAEMEIKGDLDRSGKEKWYIITIEMESGDVIRCQYSPWEHGRSSYVMFRIQMGAAEKLACLQDAGDASISQFGDLVDIMVGMKASFAFDHTSGLDINKFELRPGLPIKVDSVTGIKELPFGNNIPAALQQIIAYQSILREWTDILTGMSNPILGREAAGDKTLGEVQIVLQQGHQISEDMAYAVGLSWAEVCHLTRWVMGTTAGDGIVRFRKSSRPQATFVPEDSPVGMPAAPSFSEIPAEVLLSDVDFIPAGLAQVSGEQAQLQQAMLFLQEAKTNPLMMQNIEVQTMAINRFLRSIKLMERDQVMSAIYSRIPELMAQVEAQQAAAMQQAETQQAIADQQIVRGDLEMEMQAASLNGKENEKKK